MVAKYCKFTVRRLVPDLVPLGSVLVPSSWCVENHANNSISALVPHWFLLVPWPACW